MTLHVDIKVANTQDLEKAEDNKCVKISLRKLKLHEEAGLAIPFKRSKESTLLSAFLELC